MPNHTANNFIITGPKDTVLAFIERAKNKNPDDPEPQQLSFNSFIPFPKGTLDWYDWRVTNWGTKWDCYDVTEWSVNEMKDGTASASIYYETAWSPVTTLWLTVSQEYPDCEFYHEFADEGGGFLGTETIIDGNITKSEDFDWNSEDGIELLEGLGRYWPEDEEENVDEARVNE